LEGIATLQEIETSWNLGDLMDANLLLDMKAKIEKREMEKLKRRAR